MLINRRFCFRTALALVLAAPLSFVLEHEARAACAITPDQVAIYSDKNLSGSCAVLGPGEYWSAAQFGLPNNSVSSLQTGTNVSITLFDTADRFPIPDTSHDTFYGSGTTVSYVGNGFNDRTSAILVQARNNEDDVAYSYLGNSPSGDSSSPWHSNPQGLAHSNVYIFITNEQHIFRYAITSSLTGTPSASVSIPSPLTGRGCDHFGDPDVRQSPQGQSFLFVPVEGCWEGPVVAIFDTNLQLVTWDDLFASEQLGHASWLAFKPTNDGATWLYSSTYDYIDSGSTHPLIAYQVDWSSISYEPNGTHFLYLNYETHGLNDFPLTQVQGGVFSPDGSLLYLATGASASPIDSCPNNGVNAGMHVYRTSDFSLVARSSNGFGAFNYENHPCSSGSYDEPEGLDYLDMWVRNGAFKGYVHALMVSNGVFSDSAYLKHFNK